MKAKSEAYEEVMERLDNMLTGWRQKKLFFYGRKVGFGEINGRYICLVKLIRKLGIFYRGTRKISHIS